jgi:multiple sugar transport system substrate-binding protein
MRERPNVTVRVEATGDANTAEVRLDRQFVAGGAPDLFLTNASATTSLVSLGRVQPVDELLEERDVQFADNYERLGLEAFAADDALQCMPSDVSPHVMFYNRRLFASVVLGEPGQEPPTPQTGWTWEQFVSAAQQMSGPGVRGIHLAPALTTLTPLLRSAGTDLVDDPRQPTTLQLSDGPTRTALEQILALARNPRLTPTPAQLARRDALTRFQEGSLAMMIGTRALVPELRAHPDLAFDVFPLPALGRSQTIADVRGICISRESARIGDAADFLAFASSQRGAALTARSGGIVPANLAAVHSEAFEQRSTWPQNVDVFTTVMRRADVMPSPPAWPRVVTATQPLVDRLFYAPVLDLDSLLPRIDRISAALLVEPTPSPSESATGSPTGSPIE